MVANMRHRRSLSQGDAQWVSHEPTMPVPQSTVLQPKLKNKKSRTRLNPRDLSKSERYLLMHQEQGVDGGVETQFYKVCHLYSGFIFLSLFQILF